MSLSTIAIRKPVFAWMLMIGILIFGGLAFKNLGISQMPDVDFPMVNVSVTYDGAAPEIIETEVISEIEEAIGSVPGLVGMSSTARASSGNISAEFNLNTDIKQAVQDVQNVISRLQSKLPKDIDPPVVSRVNPDDSPIMWLAVSSSKMSPPDLMAFVRDQLQPQFAALSGVSEVFLGGYRDPQVNIKLSLDKMDRLAFTAGDIISAISSEHSEAPGGRLETKNREYNIRTLGEAGTIEQLKKLPLNRRGGSINYASIALQDVTDIEDGLADARRISRSNGMASVGIGVKKLSGANAVAVAQEVKAKLKEMQSQLPAGSEIAVRFDSTQFIEEAVAELNFTLLLSAILTALVCWIFLGSWTATLNVILAIPTSVVGSFIALYLLGFTLNLFTLLALSLAIGIVVDDAIMVLENIFRHKEMGKDRVEASLTGSREIAFAALAATLAIAAIFFPVAFMDGIIGKYFYQFGVTLSVAVFISLLEALTLTPMRCAQFLQTTHRTTRLGVGFERMIDALTRGYAYSLKLALRWRWLTILGAIGVFAVSLMLVKVLRKEFSPAEDQSRLSIRVMSPPGSSLELTDNKTKEVEAYLLKQPDVEGLFTSVGGYSGDVNTANIFVTLKDRKKRTINPETKDYYSQQELQNVYRESLKTIKGARVLIRDMSMSSLGIRGGYPLDLSIRGPEFEDLTKYSAQIKSELEATGKFTDLDTDFRDGMPELHIVPDRAQAAAYGITIADISQNIAVLMGGATAGKFSKGGKRYDIRVRLQDSDRDAIPDLNRIKIRNTRGELIPLSAVARVEEATAMQAITHRDRERAVSIFGNIKTGLSQAEAIKQAQDIARKHLPDNYHVVLDGNAKAMGESFSSLMWALFFGLVTSYMILGSQFNSFKDPVTILLALPFSVSGALLALYISDQSLNVFSMIGILLLMGIVKKNSILLVDFTNQLVEAGRDLNSALQEACPIRLRPILMTSVATVVGAVPAAISFGPGAESRAPMAISVIGGVILSTLLTLYAVPAVYSLFATALRKKGDPQLKGSAPQAAHTLS